MRLPSRLSSLPSLDYAPAMLYGDIPCLEGPMTSFLAPCSPLILLYPIFLVIFGRGINAIIAMGTLYGMIPIVLNAHQGLRDVDQVYLKVGKGMRLSERQILRHILFPAAWPMIIGGLKLGLTYILISVIALEFLVDIGGVGTLASKGYFWFNTELLYLGVVGAILLSMVFVTLLGKAAARLLSRE